MKGASKWQISGKNEKMAKMEKKKKKEKVKFSVHFSKGRNFGFSATAASVQVSVNPAVR